MLMIDTDTTVHADVAPERLFSLHDRCDRCGLQSYYVAQKGSSELLFCKHHGEDHRLALDFHGWTLLDFTIQLDPTPFVDNG